MLDLLCISSVLQCYADRSDRMVVVGGVPHPSSNRDILGHVVWSRGLIGRLMSRLLWWVLTFMKFSETAENDRSVPVVAFRSIFYD